MKLSSTHLVLIVAIVAASAFAIYRGLPPAPVESPPVGAATASSLPPNHPPIPSGNRLPTANDAPTLAWKVPA
ncbi:MAG TPA: hypothetical protein VF316_00055, partial [Polyangiaceae bacterium]